MITVYVPLVKVSPGTCSQSLFLELYFRGKNNVSMALSKSKDLGSVPWNVSESMTLKDEENILLIRILEDLID